jgi:hypothetical protein
MQDDCECLCKKPVSVYVSKECQHRSSDELRLSNASIILWIVCVFVSRIVSVSKWVSLFSEYVKVFWNNIVYNKLCV